MAKIKIKVNSNVISFLGLLTLIFITLKLLNKIDWLWIWVVSPLLIPPCAMSIFYFVCFSLYWFVCLFEWVCKRIKK